LFDTGFICFQAVFIWTYLARQISQAFDERPELRPHESVTQHLEAGAPLAVAGAGLLSPRSFHTDLSERQRQQIADVFALFDTDGGGTIDRDEFRAAAAALGLRGSRKPSNRKGSDRGASNKDGSGRCVERELSYLDEDCQLTLEEFTALMTGELTCYDPLDEIRCIFAVLSGKNGGGSDSNNRITLSSLRAACRLFNVKMSEEELESIFGAVDYDNSGTIDLEEFTRVVRNTAWF
jgi:Ca2+-binding EF-hand superfamily protein